MLEGGIYTILDNCLKKISEYSSNKDIRVIALVHHKSNFNYPNIEYLKFKKSKLPWVSRLYYEFYYFKKISKIIKPDVWLSLHDISPNVVAKKRFVYCHHATIFYKPRLKDWKFDFKICIFSLLYKYLFRINIKKNDAVFVQQNWIKKEFEVLFNINNVVCCPPEFVNSTNPDQIELDKSRVHFFYPMLTRSYKNIECIGDAISLLNEKIKNKIQVHITIAKDDSKYANYIIDKYDSDEMIFIGKQSLDMVFGYYKSIDCLLFSSKIESWGLPLSEVKPFGKAIFVSNLPYAKEAVGDYDKVSFFNPNIAQELAQLITEFVNKSIVFQRNSNAYSKESQLNDWESIFNFILK